MEDFLEITYNPSKDNESTVLKKLHSYYHRNKNKKDFSRNEINFILSCINVPNTQVRNTAITFISEFPKPIIENILTLLPTFNQTIQKQLIMSLMSVTFITPYQFLLDHLATLNDDNMSDFIITCLSKTDYQLLPMIIGRLDSENKQYIRRLKQLLKKIGFNRLESYLAMMPQIPFERYFRDVFGGTKIDQLKQ